MHLIALASLGQGLSGGDRIYIELSRRFSESLSTVIHVWEEGLDMCNREKLSGSKLRFQLHKVGNIRKLGFVVTYIYRILLGIKLGLSLKTQPKEIIFSASEFWMDSLPGFILKLRKKDLVWVAAWYQTAPKPWQGYAEGTRENRHYLRAWMYWLAQLPIKPLISHFADFVLVNNENEKSQFPKLNSQGRTIILFGAIDTSRINAYRKLHPRSKGFKYLAVFQGRFHPQKGVVELMDVWHEVINVLPGSKLALIGDGPLRSEVEAQIERLQLHDSIELFGYLSDGETKYDIFTNSQIVVHPAFYDSGGMASAEAMAFGLPCVGFDLPSYKSYYPKGMIKAEIGNLKQFASLIVKLAQDKKLYSQVSSQALEMIKVNWSWDHRAHEILQKITV